jgi:hypothetical protein
MFFFFTIRQQSLHFNAAKIKLCNAEHQKQRTYQNYAGEYRNVGMISNMSDIFLKKYPFY